MEDKVGLTEDGVVGGLDVHSPLTIWGSSGVRWHDSLRAWWTAGFGLPFRGVQCLRLTQGSIGIPYDAWKP
jgi:hypothetical protein